MLLNDSSSVPADLAEDSRVLPPGPPHLWPFDALLMKNIDYSSSSFGLGYGFGPRHHRGTGMSIPTKETKTNSTVRMSDRDAATSLSSFRFFVFFQTCDFILKKPNE